MDTSHYAVPEIPPSLLPSQTEVPSSFPESLVEDTQDVAGSHLPTIRQLCRVIRSECASPDVLPPWTERFISPEHEQRVRSLIEAWHDSQEAEENTALSLNPVDRLASKINEAAATRLQRCMQIYYLSRLRKILFNPTFIHENQDIKLVDQRELQIALAWHDYLADRDVPPLEAPPACLHFLARQELLASVPLQDRYAEAKRMFRGVIARQVEREEEGGICQSLLELLDETPADGPAIGPVLCTLYDPLNVALFQRKLDCSL
eukprot:Protomagalhaensia_wolfi_Nauph_80__285@NODE_115_length_3600_cov_79_402977_g88_i0_p2_GENE_NODE_115_length_3600_cov_79_402977_g88_i0NODE_115_length_3600_cov_79_402977_g88_i0_p2_ORF_typecomplete_len262_score35_33Orbi_NS1/PF01718_16/0_055DUF2156/PF09924_9/0_18_NODE_115_length_3600_cov_79_402977_g88_i067852